MMITPQAMTSPFGAKKIELRNKQMNYLRLPIHDTTKVTELNFVRPETG